MYFNYDYILISDKKLSGSKRKRLVPLKNNLAKRKLAKKLRKNFNKESMISKDKNRSKNIVKEKKS